MTNDCSGCLFCVCDRVGVEGTFHVQRVNNNTTVCVEPNSELKKALQELVYRNRDMAVGTHRCFHAAASSRWNIVLNHTFKNCFLINITRKNEDDAEAADEGDPNAMD